MDGPQMKVFSRGKLGHDFVFYSYTYPHESSVKMLCRKGCVYFHLIKDIYISHSYTIVPRKNKVRKVK